MAFAAGVRAPHGGIWVLPLITNFWGWLVAIAVGVVVTCAIVVALKSARPSAVVQAEQAADAQLAAAVA